jgi:hypothetical protein
MRLSIARILDRTLALLLTTAILFILFQRIYQNMLLSLLLSGLSAVLLRGLFLKLHAQFAPRCARRKARKQHLDSIMEQLVLLPPEKATAEAARLWCLGMRRPLPADAACEGALAEHEGRLTLYMLDQQPAGSLPLDAPELLRLHRAARSCCTESCVLLSTGRFTPAAQSLAERLHAPSFKLIDGEALRRAISPDCWRLPLPQPEKTAPAHWRTLPQKILSLCRPGRAALSGVLMLPLYLTLGHPLYLMGSLTCLALSALALRHRFTVPPA